MNTTRPHWSGRRAWLLIAAVVIGPAGPAAQSQPALGSTPASVTRIVAEEQTLWLARISTDSSQVYRRGVSGTFERLGPLRAAIFDMASSGGVLYAFTGTGEFWSLATDGWSRLRDLPGRLLPISLVGDATGIYALIPSPGAGELPRMVAGARPAESQPFDPQRAALSVVRYDAHGWLALAPAPPGLTTGGRLPPRLGFVHGSLCLFVVTGGAREIESFRLDFAAGDWLVGGRTPGIDGLDRFWIVTISRIPTLIAATRAADGSESLVAFRALGAGPGEVGEWRAATLQLSALPAGGTARHYASAGGFNQHAVLLSGEPQQVTFVQFAHCDGPPVEVTIPVASVLERSSGPALGTRLFHMFAPAVLFGVLLSLFVFRRQSMVNAAQLPAGTAVALVRQRLAGGLIDMAPFALAAAVALGVDWQLALRELFGWATGSDPANGHFPNTVTLEWWGLTSVSYVAYALLMELLARRTLGKLLVGTRVLSETGQPAAAAPIVVRNLVRLMELFPPLWVFGFLVVVSRNRQRLGDIYARTIVVRRIT